VRWIRQAGGSGPAVEGSPGPPVLVRPEPRNYKIVICAFALRAPGGARSAGSASRRLAGTATPHAAQVRTLTVRAGAGDGCQAGEPEVGEESYGP